MAPGNRLADGKLPLPARNRLVCLLTAIRCETWVFRLASLALSGAQTNDGFKIQLRVWSRAFGDQDTSAPTKKIRQSTKKPLN
jgi:hypothetical protein